MGKGDQEIGDLEKDLHEKILSVSDQIEVRYPQLYIAYRTTRNFAEVHVKKKYLLVYLMPIEYDDPKNKIEPVPESYQWALNKRIRINDIEDVDYAIKLIQKSYESTL